MAPLLKRLTWLSSTLKGQVLQFLLDRPDNDYESCTIARHLKASRSTVNSYLLDLENDSVVARREKGYYVYWRIQRNKYLTRRVTTRIWNSELFEVDLS